MSALPVALHGRRLRRNRSLTPRLALDLPWRAHLLSEREGDVT